MDELRRRRRPAQTDAAATKLIRTTIYGKPEEVVEQEVMIFEAEPAYVRASAGRTLNLGDYESLRIDVSITVPCYREHVRKTYENVATEVAQLLDNEIAQYIPAE